MKIYTKTGDQGETGLFSGDRIWKDDPLLHAYGSIDELNSVLGMIRCEKIAGALLESIERIQNELFDVGADLATPWGRKNGPVVRRIDKDLAEQLECEIDEAEKALEPLKEFILPGGTRASALLHFARTVCRRAEREISGVSREGKANPEVLKYVNRLSDWFFVMARLSNRAEKIYDTPWRKPL